MQKSAKKERVDILLVEQGLFSSREKAKAAIMAGIVYMNEERIEKPGMKVPSDQILHVKGAVHPYVGRGGLKMKKAIDTFNLQMNGKVALDIGASTGGFTDCALQHGAKFVYAIDVGYNQLDWKLRKDERVAVMERTNFRYMTPDQLQGPSPEMAMIDVSFISLRLMIQALKPMLPPNGEIIALIKPQFEAGRDQVGKSGIVRNPSVHEEVLHSVIQFASDQGLMLKGLTYSPITGGEGNIEFLAYWVMTGREKEPLPSQVDKLIRTTVEDAARTLT